MVTSQTVGVVLLAVAGTLLWSAWALFIAGVVLLVVPEVAAGISRARGVR